MYFLKFFAVLSIVNVDITLTSTNLDVINLVTDFILILDKPTKVSFDVCWSQNDKILLMQHLNQHLISFQLYNATKCEPNIDLAVVQLFFLDLRCEGYLELLQNVNNKNLFNQPYRWIVIINDIKDIPYNLNILVDSQFYVISQSLSNIYAIKSIYKIANSTKQFILNDIGIWTKTLGFRYFHFLTIGRNRTNLMRTNLNFSIVITNPESLNHLWDYRDRHIDSMTKLNYFFCHHIIDYLNISNKFIVRNTWGYRNETNNQFDGMVGDLQTGLAEIGGSPAVLFADRLPILDYIGATTPTNAKFIFRAPSLSHVSNILTSPFDTAVWYCCFLLVGVIVIIVYLIVICEWRHPTPQELQIQQNRLRPKLVDVFLMELGAICQQGSESEPISTSGRIATIFIFINVMFMYTFYSANIVALLQSTSESIQTVEDLLHSRIKLGAEDTAYMKYFFKVQTEPIRKAIYIQKMRAESHTSNFIDAKIGIQKVRDEFYAFHVECATGYKIIADIFEENEKCRLREITYTSLMADPWIPIRKNSSYKEITKIAFRKLHESGLHSREFRKIYYNKKPICESKGSSVTSVGLIECYYAFSIFAVGCLLSVCLFLLEMLMKRKCSQNR